MKGGNFANRFFVVFAVIVLMLQAACSPDGFSDNLIGLGNDEAQSLAVAPFSIVLKALDAEGADVTSQGEVKNVTLFVFDAQNDFVEQVSVGESALLQRQSIDIACPGTDALTVIAWGGLSAENVEISSLSQADIISALQIELKRNNGIAHVPGDLFYGLGKVERVTTKGECQELTLQRKVSSVSLITKGLVKYFGTTDGVYKYKVRHTKSAFDYKGDLTGDGVEYVFSASFDKNGRLVTDTQPVLPSSDLVIELFRNDSLLYSAEKNQAGDPFFAVAGKQMNYLFNYDGSCTSSVVVTSWGSLVKYVTVI